MGEIVYEVNNPGFDNILSVNPGEVNRGACPVCGDLALAKIKERREEEVPHTNQLEVDRMRDVKRGRDLLACVNRALDPRSQFLLHLHWLARCPCLLPARPAGCRFVIALQPLRLISFLFLLISAPLLRFLRWPT